MKTRNKNIIYLLGIELSIIFFIYCLLMSGIDIGSFVGNSILCSTIIGGVLIGYILTKTLILIIECLFYGQELDI